MKLDLPYMTKAFPDIVSYIPVTLQIVGIALLISLPVSLLFALILNKKIRVLTQIIQIYLSLIKGTPLILQIYLLYSKAPVVLHNLFKKLDWSVDVYSWNPIVYTYIVLSFMATVYLTAAFQSAINAVDKGQFEAAVSVGMTKVQAYRRIILPQAFGVAVPVIGNTVVITIKCSSLAFAMTVREITGRAKMLAATSFRYFEVYLIIFIIYILLVSAVQMLFKILENKLVRYRTAQGAG